MNLDMATLIFVHGTGVRRDSYRNTLKTIRTRLDDLNAYRKPRAEIKLAECLWGEKFGVDLNLKGDSIPDYHPEHGMRLLPLTTSKEDLELLLWGTLARDPLYELRELSRQDHERGGLGQARLGAALWHRFATFETSADVLDVLKAWDLSVCYSDALDELRSDEVFRDTVQSLVRQLHNVSNELARALIAATLMRAGAKGIPALTRQIRDALVVQISTMIAGAKLALGGWLTKTAFETLSPLLTSKGIRQRSDLSNMVSPPAGDVLKYQVRGEAIRALIEDTIKATQDDVILFAHSLGGIACVDLLVSTEILQVSHLITVGSQVPYLYEIDALWSLRPGMRLPDTFRCRWLNVYDRGDFLSYKAEAIFGRDRVTDMETRSGLAFPESHSGYFRSDEVWRFMRKEFC
jgi:hypothetical protein